MGGGIFRAMRKYGISPKDRKRKWLAEFVKLKCWCSWIAVGKKRVRWEGRVEGDSYGPGYSGPITEYSSALAFALYSSAVDRSG